MADMHEIEHMVRELHDIEAIKKLKARYWRCLDRKLWTELENVFTEDVKADYGPKCRLEGKKTVLDFLQASLGPGNVSTSHGGHSPEIEILGPVTARGIWALHNLMVRDPGIKVVEWGHYEDEYVKEAGGWKISSTRIVRIIEEQSSGTRY